MFEEYLSRYCRCYKISKEEALTHRVVILVKRYYEEAGE